MKVYIVFDHDSCIIHGVFTDERKAQIFQAKRCAVFGEVLTYETEEISVDKNEPVFQTWYGELDGENVVYIKRTANFSYRMGIPDMGIPDGDKNYIFFTTDIDATEAEAMEYIVNYLDSP